MKNNLYIYTNDKEQPKKVSLTEYYNIKKKQTKKWTWNNNRVNSHMSPYITNKKKYIQDLDKITTKKEKHLIHPVINFIYNINDLYNELLLLFKRDLTKHEMINEIKHYYYQNSPIFQDDKQINRILKNISYIYYLDDIDKYYKFNNISNNIQNGGGSKEREEEEIENKKLMEILTPVDINITDWLFHFLWVIEQKIGMAATFPLDIIGVMLDALQINIGFFLNAISPFVNIGISMIPAVPVIGPFLAPFSIFLNISYRFISMIADKIIAFITLLFTYSRKQYKLVFINFFDIIPEGESIYSLIKTLTYTGNKYIKKFIESQQFLILFINNLSSSINNIRYINNVNIEDYIDNKEKKEMKSYYTFENIPSSFKEVVKDKDKINLNPFPYILNKLDNLEKNIDNIYSINHTSIKQQKGGKYIKSLTKSKKNKNKNRNKNKYKYSKKKKYKKI